MARGNGNPNEIKILDESFDALVIINRSRVALKANANGYFDDPAQSSKGILTKVEIAASDLETLKLRIKQHVDLVDE
jgi:hypothetical protein